MACVCGHAIEEHQDEIGPCEGTITVSDGNIARREKPCECLGYEEEEGDDEDDL